MSDEEWGSTNTEDIPIPGDSTLEELEEMNQRLTAVGGDITKLKKGKGKAWTAEKGKGLDDIHKSIGYEDFVNTRTAFDANYAPVEEAKGMHVKDFMGVPSELRPRRGKKKQGLSNTAQVYDKLIDILLNAKRDIDRVPSCLTLDGAERYANAHDLYFYGGEKKAVDYNDDGVDEIVLVNRQGQPVVVNGYKLSHSDLPFKREYYSTYNTPDKRAAIGGYQGFLREKYGADAEFGEDGTRNVKFNTKNPPKDWDTLKRKGWILPSAPRNKLTINQRCNKIIQNHLTALLDNHPEIGKLKRPWIKGVIPRMKIVCLAFTCLVDSVLWKRLDEDQRQMIINHGGGDQKRIMEEYAAYKAENKDGVDGYIKNNLESLLKYVDQNADEVLKRILGDIGLIQILSTNGLVTDVQMEEVKRGNPAVYAEFKRYKRGVKSMLDTNFDKIKPQYIKNFFGF